MIVASLFLAELGVDSFQCMTLIAISFFPDGGNITFSLRNTTFQNNSLVNLKDIGESDDDALLCITELSACCQHLYTNDTEPALGNWFFPNGTRIPGEVVDGTTGLQFNIYRTRGHSVVLLHRRKGGVNGIYRCEIPDALGVIQTIYIEATTGK